MGKRTEFIKKLLRLNGGAPKPDVVVAKPKGEALAEAENKAISLADAMRSRRSKGQGIKLGKYVRNGT